MSQSDRLLLEEICPTLHQKLASKIVDDPSVQVHEQDLQDFEVGLQVSSSDHLLTLRVAYPFLSEVLGHGSDELLERAWAGLPLRRRADQGAGVMDVVLDTQALGEEAARRQCAHSLAATRIWLLIGPLVGRLQHLRDAVDRAEKAAAAAPPGGAAIAAAQALGERSLSVLCFRVRRLETCWIVSKPDRVTVIMSIHLEDEVDVALARAFCQEFAEANRNPQVGSLPCTFNEPKDIPSDLRDLCSFQVPNVGFIAFTLSDRCVRGATEERLYSLARPVMTFRNFFNFHLKHAKTYLHSRLRKRLDDWQQTLNQARRAPRRGQEKRRLLSGKEFVPPPRAT